MDTNPIVQEMIEKTYRELAHPKDQAPRSRVATTTNGYIHLTAWSNTVLLRILVRKFTEGLLKSEYRLKAQLDDAARSVVANIEEGYSRPTTLEYLTFLGYSQASLIEVKGDIERSLQDGFLQEKPGSSLAGLGIDLAMWHEALKQSVGYKQFEECRGEYRKIKENRGESRNENNSECFPLPSFRFLYSPVDSLTTAQMSYKIFNELINKTNWHLKRLVVSLEEKLNRDRKSYQVEKARIRGNVSWRR